MTILNVDSLALSYGAKEIIGNISFSINEGDRLGVVGVNGSGKTTLLSMITGDVTADSGSVYIARGKTVGLLRQNDAFSRAPGCPDTVLGQMYGAFPRLLEIEARLSVLERMMTTLPPGGYGCMTALREHDELTAEYRDSGGLYYRARCVSVLARLGFDETYHGLPVDSLSGGQRTRLALVRLVLSEPDILMLDEPTNHLDIDSLVWLEGFLSSYKKTVVVVSHDRYFLDRVTNKTLEIEHGRSTLYPASYSGYAEMKRRDREAREKHWQAQQREIKHQLDIIEQQRRWGQERNFVTIKSRERYLEHMTLIDRPDALPKSIKFRLEAAGRSGNDVLDVRGLSMGYGEGGDLFSDLSFSVKRKDRLFVLGSNGCGKSTLIKLLTGKLTPRSGVIEYGYHVEVGYYDQENQNLNEKNTIIEELWGEYPSLTQTEVRSALARFLFVGDDIEKPVSVLSGGERARLTFCKLILSRVNLLILDEPTNHLDIKSREALEDALAEFDGTIVAVSHDRYFIEKLATRILPLGGVGAKVWEGGYEDYMAHLAAPAEAVEAAPEISTNKERYLAAKQKTAELRRRQRELERITAEAEAAEGELIAVEEELFGDAASDYIRAAELDEKKVELENRIYDLYAREEELRTELQELESSISES